MPKARSKFLATEEMTEETTWHGTINEEAKIYIQNVDDIFNHMRENIEKGMGNAMEKAIMALK